MVQMNFTVDLDYLMSNLHPSVRSRIPITVVHGHRYDESRAMIAEQAKQWPNVKLVLPKLRDRFGNVRYHVHFQ